MSTIDEDNKKKYRDALALFVQEHLKLNYIPEIGNEVWNSAESWHDPDPESYRSFDYDNPGHYSIQYRKPGITDTKWNILEIEPENYSMRDIVMGIGKFMK
jgi:hypothetical protein